MRRFIAASFVVLIWALTVIGQTTAPVDVGTPAGAGDKNLADSNVKLRSVELERIKREANKTATIRREDGVELNFNIIKNDFEGIQKEQDKIIKAYQSGATVEYGKIHASAGAMTEMAIRLKASLFQPEPEEKDPDAKESDKIETKVEKPKSVRNLIVEIDNTIGALVTNPMFSNLQSIDPALSSKAQADLDKIIELSGKLWLESNKKKTK